MKPIKCHEGKMLSPRHLRRSVARANMDRKGITKLNTRNINQGIMKVSKFAANWRRAAFVPSDQDIAESKRQHEKDAKRRRKERVKA